MPIQIKHQQINPTIHFRRKYTHFAFSKWKNLKTLIIAHDDPLTETFEFQVVGESCNNLTNLKYLGGLGKETVVEIVRYLKNIKRLSLQCAYVSRPGVLLLITGLQNLAILNVLHCKEFDDQTKQAMVGRARVLWF
uniref:FBD domain-containing protein n=1 Tax=Brassica oleracea TaxID=3712 RepID=A0A3P6ACL6_BRAOL|nr:unnamed protein product [Brassica oleracea]